ncbi:hypothetical protein KY290_021618 [Solanum tuberosum]|uniref:Uncharacterized protein n=1 Tax=Solanum tuberosum TaxID=4113 RepID=A0ABQ7V577_SOLTU|nr:hypothetical protein KY289_020786 [Solanum tuberosum]KAH0758125.1 hypothetical protein KY290_021618 [Solanum tuberosum]
MEKSLAGTETYGCSTGHLLSKELFKERASEGRNGISNVLLAAVTNLRGLFNRAVIKIAIKIEYAEVPLSSASLIVHPVDSQFVKEHRTMTVRSQVNQKSYPWLSSVCCECHSRFHQ